MELAGKVCVVVGAGGTIGASVATHLHRLGAHLIYTRRRPKQASPSNGSSFELPQAPSYQLDVTNVDQVQSVVSQIVASTGRIDVLVNCSGVVGPIGPLETNDMGRWVSALEINLFGCVYLAHAVIPMMKAAGRGKLIFFSGGGAAYARPCFSAYAASKAALVRFTETLAEELNPANIQVNAVAPGPVKSQMWDEMRAASASGGPKLAKELSQMDETGGVPPERAAALVAFLASDRSNRITGRLLSSVWDDWQNLAVHDIEKIATSDAWTLRRMPLK